jgi:F0F1-type ATP synthase assembly protein I
VDDRSTLRALALVSGLGFAIAIPLGLFFVGGLWLDERLGTKPLFMLLGLLVGLIAAGGTIAQLLAFRRGEREPQKRRAMKRAPEDSGETRRSGDG